MNISIFDAFGWKIPIHAPKIVFLGNLIPYMGCNINQSQKGTPLRDSASFEPLSVKMWWAVWPLGELLKKVINKQILVIAYLTYLPRSPHGRISTKFCIAVEVMDVITGVKFFSDQLRDVDSVGVKNVGLPLTKPIRC